MKQIYSIALLLLLLLSVSTGVSAQIKGVITDSLTHEPLMYITVQYEGKGVGGISNAEGEYQVETRKGWNELTFSAIGYITKKVKFAPGTKVLNVELAPADVMLSEVVVKPKKEKYSRKNNPAVEFMKKVIENKKALPSLQGLFYICEYFGITPQQFFDDGNAYPVQLADLVEDMKKLDAASLEHIAAIVKEMVNK